MARARGPARRPRTGRRARRRTWSAPPSTALAALLAVASLSAAAVATAPVARAETVRYDPPVDAPVVDPFRPPPHPYGPGNRGLEYGTGPGDAVRASAPGQVVFAGPVGGTLHVTLLHPDGLRTSYSFLADLAVRVGDEVDAGALVGTTGGALHFGARAGEEYLDPALLFTGAAPRARLVPVEPEGWSLGRERAALWEVVVGAAGAGWSALWQRSAPWLHYVRELPVSVRMAEAAVAIVRRRYEQRRCTPAGQPPPRPGGERRIVVLVAGLTSSSDSGSIDDLDVTSLGYAEGDVVRFSYRGGQVPPGEADRPGWGTSFPDLPASTYDAADTEVDLRVSGARLLDLLHRLAAEAPGVPIDVIAHSQGGVVARVALAQGEVRGLPASLTNVVTLGTPHDGADLATAAVAVGADGAGATALQVARDHLELELHPDGRSITQLAETSLLVHQLRRRPPPPTVRARSIAARGDLVVPVPRTRWPGAEHAVVGIAGHDDHSALPSSPASHREVALALAGAPPTCESLRDTVADQLAGEAVSWVEDVVGAGTAGLLTAG